MPGTWEALAIVAGIAVVVGGVLFWMGFRLTEINARFPFIHLKLTRSDPAHESKHPNSDRPIEARQTVEDDGRIDSSSIRVDKSASATAEQTARRKGEISDSRIEID